MKRFFISPFRASLIALTALFASAGCTSGSKKAVDRLIPMPANVEITGWGTVYPKETVVITDVPDDWDEEQYSLSVSGRRIEIRAASPRAELWARRTLGQLADESGRYPRVKIEDRPEFPLRGFMWDDGRNFAGKDIIKHYLDLMSAYKLNLFHWHLTDHPAWRIESRCHPQLNDPAYQRQGRDEGAFYTYDDLREIMEYANVRGITVMPEIDMPGHSTYFKAAFGCTMDSEAGRKILEDCIEEFCSEIPVEMCPYIHIGSDEVNVADPAAFMSWAQETVRKYGRRTFVWEPGLLADSLSVRQIWRDGSVIEQLSAPDCMFVDSSMGYLNYYDPLLFPAKMFFHTPCYTGKSSENALGGILCMWNDVRLEDKSLAEHHNGLAAGMLAFAERFWNGGRTTEKHYGTVLPAEETPEMQAFEAFQRRIEEHKKRFIPEELAYWTPLHAPAWKVKVTSWFEESEFTAYGDILDLDALCAQHSISPGENLKCVIRRTIHSDRERTAYFNIGFDSPARSNRISDGIPGQGSWPNDGYVLVNGERLSPPVWENPGSFSFRFNTWARPEEEIPYTGEQLYWMCPPIPVHLNKGDNTVEIGLGRNFRGQRFHAAFIERPEAEK